MNVNKSFHEAQLMCNIFLQKEVSNYTWGARRDKNKAMTIIPTIHNMY